MVGRATFTIVLSIPTSNTPRHSAVRAHQRRRRSVRGPAPAGSTDPARWRGPAGRAAPLFAEVAVGAAMTFCSFVERRTIDTEQRSITTGGECQVVPTRGDL